MQLGAMLLLFGSGGAANDLYSPFHPLNVRLCQLQRLCHTGNSDQQDKQLRSLRHGNRLLIFSCMQHKAHMKRSNNTSSSSCSICHSVAAPPVAAVTAAVATVALALAVK